MNFGRLGCIIQARTGSSRLPKKVLMKVDDDNTVLGSTINQIKSSSIKNKIIIATTKGKDDKKIIEIAKEMSTHIFEGNPSDLLDRYYKAAKKFSLKIIVRITSDCPLTDPNIIDQVLDKYHTGKFDYVTNKLPMNNPTFPQGTEVEVFSFEALEKAWKNAKKPSEREHVTPYFYTNKGIFRIGSITNKQNLSFLRYTIDTKSDLIFVQQLLLHIKKRPIIMKDILDVVKTNPDLLEINKDHIINEGYLKSINNE